MNRGLGVHRVEAFRGDKAARGSQARGSGFGAAGVGGEAAEVEEQVAVRGRGRGEVQHGLQLGRGRGAGVVDVVDGEEALVGGGELESMERGDECDAARALEPAAGRERAECEALVGVAVACAAEPATAIEVDDAEAVRRVAGEGAVEVALSVVDADDALRVRVDAGRIAVEPRDRGAGEVSGRPEAGGHGVFLLRRPEW